MSFLEKLNKNSFSPGPAIVQMAGRAFQDLPAWLCRMSNTVPQNDVKCATQSVIDDGIGEQGSL